MLQLSHWRAVATSSYPFSSVESLARRGRRGIRPAGTAESALRRAGGATMLVVTAVPVANLDALAPSKEDRKRADYLLYVLAPAKADSARR